MIKAILMAVAPFLLGLAPVAALAQTTTPARSVEGQRVYSFASPRLTVEIAPELVFLGRGEGLAMNNRARYERFLFGEVRDGKLVRAAIVHFERFVDGVDGAFNYPSFRTLNLLGQNYLHQIWPMPENDIFPQSDLRGLLERRGVTAEPAWLLGRYARGVEPALREEVLIFYAESETALGIPIAPLVAQWQPRGVAEAPGQAVEAAFAARMAAAVRIVPAADQDAR